MIRVSTALALQVLSSCDIRDIGLWAKDSGGRLCVLEGDGDPQDVKGSIDGSIEPDVSCLNVLSFPPYFFNLSEA